MGINPKEGQRSAWEDFASAVQKSALAGTLLQVVLHGPGPGAGDVRKVKGTLRVIAGRTVIQWEESMTEGRVAQVNVPLADTVRVLTEGDARFHWTLEECASASGGANLSQTAFRRGTSWMKTAPRPI